MEATTVYWVNMGIMEKKMKTIIFCILGIVGDNRKGNGNYHSILRLYGDNGREN